MFVLRLKKIKLECTRTGFEREKNLADGSHVTTFFLESHITTWLCNMCTPISIRFQVQIKFIRIEWADLTLPLDLAQDQF